MSPAARFDVAYTPGHAVHHVSYLDRTDGTAYVGDTAGIRVAPGYMMPATPPPDIDLELLGESLQRIEAWHPSRSSSRISAWARRRPHTCAMLPGVAGALRRVVRRRFEATATTKQRIVDGEMAARRRRAARYQRQAAAGDGSGRAVRAVLARAGALLAKGAETLAGLWR